VKISGLKKLSRHHHERHEKRVRQIMMAFRAAEPVFEVFAHCFKVTLFPVNSEGNEDVNGGVMFEFIQNNPGKNTKQIQAQLNVPRRTVERRLLELKSQGKINH